ncbi:MAG TPA: type II toxin-antitoxin system VapB family antitoxin [Longimicrobium sp.]|nr:type II toxin-antitoxin system VapB family antitoxin [Longimicrobium sp.]
MALNIKNEEVERLAIEVCRLTGESKTEAIRKALVERRERLAIGGRGDRTDELMRWLREEVWPQIPADQRGRRLTPDEEADILGYGPDGV